MGITTGAPETPDGVQYGSKKEQFANGSSVKHLSGAFVVYILYIWKLYSKSCKEKTKQNIESWVNITSGPYLGFESIHV